MYLAPALPVTDQEKQSPTWSRRQTATCVVATSLLLWALIVSLVLVLLP